MNYKRMRALIIQLERKGGVGKSQNNQIADGWAANLGLRRIHLDGDSSNSSTATVFPGTSYTDLSRPEGVGPVLAAIAAIATDDADVALWDIGARDEGRVQALLPKLVAACNKANIKIIVVRPVTTGHFVQQNAGDFVKFARPLGIAVVFANMVCQGRQKDDFRFWLKTETRAEALEYAAECDIPDAGAFFGDNASSFGLSLVDVANGDFSRVDPDEAEIVADMFDLNFQAFAASYLAEATEILGAAMDEAIARADMWKSKDTDDA